MSIFKKLISKKNENSTNNNHTTQKKTKNTTTNLCNRKIIFLDPGFGYSNPGGGRNGYFSYIPNAQVTYTLANLLCKDYEVFITQPLNYAEESLTFNILKNKDHTHIHTILQAIIPNTGEKKIVGYKNYSKCYNAKERMNAINKTINGLKKINQMKNVDIYALSIQHNCVKENKKNDNIEGMEVFYNNTNSYSEHQEKSKKLCENILKICKNIYSSKDREQNLIGNNFLITQIDCPAAYVEIEFIDNLNKQKIISDKNKQLEMATGLKKAIQETIN